MIAVFIFSHLSWGCICELWVSFKKKKKIVFYVRKTLPVSMMVSNMLYKLFLQQSMATKRNEILRTVETFLATTTTKKHTNFRLPINLLLISYVIVQQQQQQQ